MAESTSNTSKLDAVSETITEILDKHGVFGKTEGRYLECEKSGYVRMVRHHTQDRYADYLEISYREVGVRLIVHTTVNADGYAEYRDITAFDHPWFNDSIDYKALDAELKAAINH